MILLIDNYDSFVHNLARYFMRLGHSTLVVRNDRITVDEIEATDPAAIVLSPGPCTPAQAGVSLDVVKRFCKSTPILGVCLGHQAIGAALGAQIVRAPQPLHGRTSRVFHDGSGIFKGVPSPFLACRYHSLVIHEPTLPADLEVTARTADGTIMAVQHRTSRLVGVQFHPESILTEHGYVLLENFLSSAGLTIPKEGAVRTELVAPLEVHTELPAVPVTF